MSEVTDTDVAKERRSIVPAKYGSKYKKGGSDELAKFINEQCTADGGFQWDRFFQLARAVGVEEGQVAKYEDQVNQKLHGAPGRARMTLRNLMATIARKNGRLPGLDGEEHEVHVPKPVTANDVE